MPKIEPVSKYQDDLIRSFFSRVTIPLLADASPAPKILGSGTLFRHEDRSFLVTASHILKTDPDDPASFDINLSDIAIPSKLQHAELFTLGEFHIYRPKPPSRIDVAVLELKSLETVAKLDKNWGFLSFDQIGLYDPNDRFVVSGYPFEGSTYKNNVVGQNMLTLSTDTLNYNPKVDHPEPKFDRFFHLESEGQMLDGSRRKMPRLQGLSGAAVWSLDEFYDGIWSPQVVLRVIGVQSSAVHGKWFRCVDWEAVRLILRDPEVAFCSPP